VKRAAGARTGALTASGAGGTGEESQAGCHCSPYSVTTPRQGPPLHFTTSSGEVQEHPGG